MPSPTNPPIHQSYRPPLSSFEYLHPRPDFVSAHHRIVAGGTHEPSLLAIMSPSMRVNTHAFWKHERSRDCIGIHVAIEINPLPTIHRPRLPPKRLANARTNNRLFQRPEMFASHIRAGMVALTDFRAVPDSHFRKFTERTL